MSAAAQQRRSELASSCRTSALNDGCAMCNRSAARVKFSSSATAMKIARQPIIGIHSASLRRIHRTGSEQEPLTSSPTGLSLNHGGVS